jgi:hypothetical protein
MLATCFFFFFLFLDPSSISLNGFGGDVVCGGLSLSKRMECGCGCGEEDKGLVVAMAIRARVLTLRRWKKRREREGKQILEERLEREELKNVK